ncbi:MAG: hypothetical protein EXX96DRAFT_536950 [Benjaminiella poitrasii]|nr:MAG: hypothetical protein EXX96DRAFT_536950 [Benjaminiella poitrasii]
MYFFYFVRSSKDLPQDIERSPIVMSKRPRTPQTIQQDMVLEHFERAMQRKMKDTIKPKIRKGDAGLQDNIYKSHLRQTSIRIHKSQKPYIIRNDLSDEIRSLFHAKISRAIPLQCLLHTKTMASEMGLFSGTVSVPSVVQDIIFSAHAKCCIK